MTEQLTIDAKGLAKALNICLRTLRTRDAAGQIPKANKLGRRLLWSTAEVRAWVEAGMPDRDAWEKIKTAKVR